MQQISSTLATLLLLFLCQTKPCETVAFERRMLFGRGDGGLCPTLHTDEEPFEIDSDDAGSERFDQILDHFAKYGKKDFWKQTFFYNKAFADGAGINFLVLGGEAPFDVNRIQSSRSPFVDYARDFNATLYGLEHRFYGASRPTSNLTMESLALLTSQQALEDIAYFISVINAKKASPQKWIIFGGSYAGVLALRFRAKFPDVVLGAVASSAPLRAQIDFDEYLGVVADDVKSYDDAHPEGIGCGKQIREAVATIERRMQSEEGRKTLDDAFKIRPALFNTSANGNNVALFFQSLQSRFLDAAQYDGVSGIAAVCDIMAKPGDEDSVARLRRVQLYPHGSPADETDVDFNELIGMLLNTEWSDDGRDQNSNSLRTWTWQLCMQFGWFLTTNGRGRHGLFGTTLPSSLFVRVCNRVFQQDSRRISSSVDRANARYGERAYFTGTNIVATHGTHDPWHPLAKQRSLHRSVAVFAIKDGTHCRDELPANGDASVELAQQLIRANLERWLNGPPNPDREIKISDDVGKRPRIRPFNPPPLHFFTEDESSRRWASGGASARRKRDMTAGGRRFVGMLPPPLATTASESSSRWPPGMREGTVVQPFDHFNATIPFTFQQRFLMNDAFGSAAGANFLMLGGESVHEQEAWIRNEDLPWIKYAKEFGANVFYLEHRYYGKSKLKTTDLRYLTSSQAIFDVASFIRQAKLGLRLSGPWITFGGSYSGSLAVWSRQWFPELISGAVASSAPLQAKVDFYDYLYELEFVYSEISGHCYSRALRAFIEIRNLMISPEGRAKLSEAFKLSPPWTPDQSSVPPESIQSFYAGLYGLFEEVALFSGVNNEKGAAHNLTTLCDLMTEHAATQKALDALVEVHKWLGSPVISTDPGRENKALMERIAHIDGHDALYSDEQLAELLWTWQRCNEFGFFKSTNYVNMLFNGALPPNFYTRVCEDVFGVSAEHLTAGVANTNYLYGGIDRFAGSSSVLTNGGMDPWADIGLCSSETPSLLVIVTIDTAHCADMYAERAEDSPSLRATRRLTRDAVRMMIGPHPDEKTTELYATPSSAPVPTTTNAAVTSSASTLLVMVASFVSLWVFT